MTTAIFNKTKVASACDQVLSHYILDNCTEHRLKTILRMCELSDGAIHLSVEDFDELADYL